MEKEWVKEVGEKKKVQDCTNTFCQGKQRGKNSGEKFWEADITHCCWLLSWNNSHPTWQTPQPTWAQQQHCKQGHINTLVLMKTTSIYSWDALRACFPSFLHVHRLLSSQPCAVPCIHPSLGHVSFVWALSIPSIKQLVFLCSAELNGEEIVE